MNENDLSSYFPNSPLPPGSKQPGKDVSDEVGPSEGYDEVELPQYDPYRPIGPTVEKIDCFQQRNAPLFLVGKLQDSFYSAIPGAFEKTAKHYLAAFKGGEVADEKTLGRIKSLVDEIADSPLRDQRRLFETKLRPFLLNLRLTRR